MGSRLARVVVLLMLLAVVWNLVAFAGPLSAVTRLAHRAVDLGDASAQAVMKVSDFAMGTVTSGFDMGKDFWQGIASKNLPAVQSETVSPNTLPAINP